jgi:hypothetical protein
MRWSGRAAGCTCTWERGGTTRREARRPRRRPPPPVAAGGLRRPRSGSGGRWAPATTHAIPLAQGSVLAQLRRDGSPFESSGQVAGRKPRRSRALLACQQDTDQAWRSLQGVACWLPGIRANARPAHRAAHRPTSTIPPVWGETGGPSTGAQSAKRAPTQRSGGNGGAWSTIDPVNW